MSSLFAENVAKAEERLLDHVDRLRRRFHYSLPNQRKDLAQKLVIQSLPHLIEIDPISRSKDSQQGYSKEAAADHVDDADLIHRPTLCFQALPPVRITARSPSKHPPISFSPPPLVVFSRESLSVSRRPDEDRGMFDSFFSEISGESAEQEVTRLTAEVLKLRKTVRELEGSIQDAVLELDYWRTLGARGLGDREL